MTQSVSVAATFSYETHGTLTAGTSDVWVVFHGYGQLAKHFIRRFDVLGDAHYAIAPQGQNKFYLDAHENRYEKVGASWLTKETREQDMANQMAYVNAVWSAENPTGIAPQARVHLLGFSQGASVACRWAVHRQLPLATLVLWAGMLPEELHQSHFAHLAPDTDIVFVAGNQDPLVTPARREAGVESLKAVFPDFRLVTFEGGHEVKREVLVELMAGK